MAPQRIIIVRHGERQDQANPGFSRSTLRPHDAPLSCGGVSQARQLGHFLATNVDMGVPTTAEVVFVSSPLIRCIQTAVSMIDAMDRRGAVLIHTEPDLVEVAASIAADCRRNPAVGGQIPAPLWLPIAEVEKRLSPPPSAVLTSSVTGCTQTPSLDRDSHGTVVSDDHLCRAAHFLDGVLAAPSLSGKTVVIVTHAHVALALRAQLLHCDQLDQTLPDVTSFLCADLQASSQDQRDPAAYRARQTQFISPHLAAD